MPISSRWNFFKSSKKIKYYDQTMLNWGFLHKAWPFAAMQFYTFNYAHKVFRADEFYNPEFMSALKRLNDEGLLENAKAWPAENSIIVYEDIILVITDEKDLQKARQLLAEQEQKEQALKDKIKAAAKPAVTSQPQPQEEAK